VADSLPSLSVAVLAYNEEATLEAAVRHVLEALVSKGVEHEILVIDDGSTDRTAVIAEALEAELGTVRLVRHGHNRGPGSGIRTGIGLSTKEAFTFFAADMQGEFEERLRYLGRLGRDVDILVGQRSGRPGSSPWRQVTSRVFVHAMKRLYALPFDDFNFFYFFTSQVLAAVEPTSQTAFICPEIMIRALDMGFRVQPVPGQVRPRPAGRATVGQLGHVARVTREMTQLWVERGLREVAEIGRASGLGRRRGRG
jgi:dolichol-phosphate mannosyltransferase